MPWARLDDNFPYHPKTVRALKFVRGRERLQRLLGQYVAGLLYANKFLTDGFIPFDEVAGMQGEALADTLVQVGLWEPVDGGFQIHDYHHYNDSAADVSARREADRERKRLARGGLPATPNAPPSRQQSIPLSGRTDVTPRSVSGWTPISKTSETARNHWSSSQLSERTPDRVQPDGGRTEISVRPDISRPRVGTRTGAAAGLRVGAPAGIRTVPIPGLKSKDKSTAFGGTNAPSAEDKTPAAEAEEHYRVILRIAHDVIQGFGAEPEFDCKETIKEQCARARIPYNGRVVQKAYDAAVHVRTKKKGRTA